MEHLKAVKMCWNYWNNKPKIHEGIQIKAPQLAWQEHVWCHVATTTLHDLQKPQEHPEYNYKRVIQFNALYHIHIYNNNKIIYIYIYPALNNGDENKGDYFWQL